MKSPNAAPAGGSADLPPSYHDLHPQQEPTLTAASATTSPPRQPSPRLSPPSMGLAEAITHILGVGPIFRPAEAPSTTQQSVSSATATPAQSARAPVPPQIHVPAPAPGQTPLPVATSTHRQPTSVSRPSLSTALGSSIGVNPRETIDRLSHVLGAVMGAMAVVRPQSGASTQQVQRGARPHGKEQTGGEKQ